MEYVEVGKSGTMPEGIGTKQEHGPKVEAAKVKPGPAALPMAQAPAYGHVPGTAQPIPRIPVFMDDDENFVDFRKPGFWAYGHSVFALGFGIVLLALFSLGGGIVGFIIGAAILGGLMWMVRSRLWAKTGYWFTNRKIVIHDGSKIRLVPYDEIALSTLSFEGENCMFNTIYDQEIILKGILDMEQVVAFISTSVKREKRKGGEKA